MESDIENQSSTAFNDMQLVKRRLFAMRNGVVADALRKGGSPFSIIFGVNLPQLVEIARDTGLNKQLAERLWANTTTRESLLLAPMLMPHDDFSEAEAEAWVAQVPAAEVADVLCLKLLRYEPYALQLVKKLSDSDEWLARYTAIRLMCHLASEHPAEALALARREAERQDPCLRMVCAQLLDRLD